MDGSDQNVLGIFEDLSVPENMPLALLETKAMGVAHSPIR
jgi:hypothetical protein